MKKQKSLMMGIIVIIIIQNLYSQKIENQIIINVDLGKDKISRHIYGHFSEHLGHCIYGGIWVGEDSKIPNLDESEPKRKRICPQK